MRKGYIKTNMTSFLKELEEVCKRCGRKRQDVKVVYATKYLNPEQFVSFIDIVREFEIDPVLIGENRVQEAIEKSKSNPAMAGQISRLHLPSARADGGQAKINIKNQKLTSSGIKWIMIGTLQKNKINKALTIFEEIHSVDSVELAEAIDMRLQRVRHPRGGVAPAAHPGGGFPIFLEVNVSGEEAKHGFIPEEIDKAIIAMKQCSNLTIKGLMTMAPHFENPQAARPIFRKLRQLADRHHLLTSMGMSNDWKIAVAEGADYIRIGSRIFSP